MIRITCRQNGFWRCRVQHPKGTKDYPDGTFTEGQNKRLQEEPKLVVEILKDEDLVMPVAEQDNGPIEEKIKADEEEAKKSKSKKGR
jgi:hypothetical protein